jgi:hypothetical protein
MYIWKNIIFGNHLQEKGFLSFVDSMKTYHKYPRTPHLPWSLGTTKDDKKLQSVDHFTGQHVVITEKLDGENTTIAHNRIYARSIDSKDHPSRHWIKNNFSYLSKTLNPKYRICGENVFAEHSIPYCNLDSYFYGFSVWREDDCLSWQSTVSFLNQYLIVIAPILYIGIWDELICKSLMKTQTDKGLMEGYVVRCTRSFKSNEFEKNVAKFVRKDHVQTDEHWLEKPLIKNKLR